MKRNTNHFSGNMFKILFLTIQLCWGMSFLSAQSGNVGIGTSTPDPSAILDLTSDSSGILVPRMTAVQRDAIDSPALGLMVFVTDDNSFYCYEGSIWEKVGARGIMLEDTDADTKVQVEKTADDDMIRFDLGGTEYFRMDGNRLEFLNASESIYIGKNVGLADTFGNIQHNVFIGNNAGTNNAYALPTYSVGIGTYALHKNTSGNDNTAVGAYALQNNTSAYHNTAIGKGALNSNTASENTAVGASALQTNTTGNNNAALGYNALRDNETGKRNVAVGALSLENTISGDDNVAIGSSVAAHYPNDLSRNVMIGSEAMWWAANNSANTAIGYRAGFDAKVDSSVYLGYKAGYYNTSDNRLFIENSDADSANALIYGEFDNDLVRINGQLIATGGLADADNDTRIQVEEGMDDDTIRFDMGGTEYFRMANGRLEVVNTGNSILIGEDAGGSDPLSGTGNIFLGLSAGNSTTGYQNIAIGNSAMQNNSTGAQNIAIGTQALQSNDDGTANLAIGQAAMRYHLTGDGNTALGHNALSSDTSSTGNTTVGAASMNSNTSGIRNSVLGRSSLSSNTTGSENTSIGFKSLDLNVSGNNNSAVGYNALKSNISGEANTALGYEAGRNNLGDSSVYLGNQAGYYNTNSHRLFIENTPADSANALIYGEFDNDLVRINGQLIATGGLADADNDTKIQVEESPDEDMIRFDMGGTEYFRMTNGRMEVLNTDGSVFIGQGAGASDELSGNHNVFIGDSTGTNNDVGVGNTAVGYQALKAHSGFWAGNNSAFGNKALHKTTSGFRNTAIGTNTLSNNTSGANNVAIGADALLQMNGSYNIAIGAESLNYTTSGTGNTALGMRAGRNNLGGSYNVFLGYNAGRDEPGSNRLYIENSFADSANALIYGEFDNNLVRINGQLIATGGFADADNDTRIQVEEGMDDDTIRFDMGGTEYFRMANGRMEVVNTGESVFIGRAAGASDDLTENHNVAVGSSALSVNSSGERNTAVGFEALKANTGDNNTALGQTALSSNTSGFQNTGIGNAAIQILTVGSNNTAVGNGALKDLGTGDDNTVVGSQSLSNNTSGEGNTTIGRQSGFNATGSHNVFLGFQAGYSETGSNRLYIENSDNDQGNALIYGEFDNDILTFNAQVGIGTTSPESDLHVIGNGLLRDTLRSTLTLQMDDNNKDVGLAFRRQAANYEWNIFREGGGSQALVFASGNASDITTLTPRMLIEHDGDVGIGASPTAKLTVNGVANKPGGGAWAVFSDIRLKEVNSPYTRGLDEIMQLQPVSFHYREDNPYSLPTETSYIGYVAQEVQKVIPEAVETGSDDFLVFNADPVYCAMVNAIKELKTEKDSLQEELDRVKQEFQDYQAAIEARLQALEEK